MTTENRNPVIEASRIAAIGTPDEVDVAPDEPTSAVEGCFIDSIKIESESTIRKH